MSQRREKRLRALEDRLKIVEASYAHRLYVKNLWKRVERIVEDIDMICKDISRLKGSAKSGNYILDKVNLGLQVTIMVMLVAHLILHHM